MTSQLFRCVPDLEFVNRVVSCFNLRDINDTTEFWKITIQNFNTIDKLINLIPELNLYYNPCKAKNYLNNINENRCVTILRHFIKIYHYRIIRRERIVNKNKFTFYRINSDTYSVTNLVVFKKKVLMNFD